MKTLGSRLRARAAELGMSNAEVARAAGVSEQRYGNYVSDLREPDLATFVRIAKALQTSPSDLLAFDGIGAEEKDFVRERLVAAAQAVPREVVPHLVVQLEALVKVQKKRGRRLPTK